MAGRGGVSLMWLPCHYTVYLNCVAAYSMAQSCWIWEPTVLRKLQVNLKLLIKITFKDELFSYFVYVPAHAFVQLRHGDRQHGGNGPAEGGFARQGAGSHAEETSPPEWEKTQQSHPSGALHCWHRQETFWPTLAWKKRWDPVHSHFFFLHIFHHWGAAPKNPLFKSPNASVEGGW